jgi:hypothetical protein
MDKLLQQLIDAVKMATPVIWEALVRQVYVSTIAFGVGGVILCVFSIALAVAGKKTDISDGDHSIQYAFWFFSFFFASASMALFTCGVMRWLNPNYYAIQMIIDSLRTP